MATVKDSDLLVQLASYNTNLQGSLGLPQDLVDWLAPTLQVSTFLSRAPRAPDIVAVGFQELLPLHLGRALLFLSLCAMLTSAVISVWTVQVRHQRTECPHCLRDRSSFAQQRAICPNCQGRERRCRASRLWTRRHGEQDGVRRADELDGMRADVYGKQRRSWRAVSCSRRGRDFGRSVHVRLYLRFLFPLSCLRRFVCAHLTAHAENLDRRLFDYKHIVGSLLFPPLPSSESPAPSTIYDTSNLFFLGDLNFRLVVPTDHPLHNFHKIHDVSVALESEATREELKEYDQLLIEQRKGNVLVGLREGEFWKFKCTYKYQPGQVDQYRSLDAYLPILFIHLFESLFSTKRSPSWTDRILYTTHTDTPFRPEVSNIKNLLYTNVPGYTASDHVRRSSQTLLFKFRRPFRNLSCASSPFRSKRTRCRRGFPFYGCLRIIGPSTIPTPT